MIVENFTSIANLPDIYVGLEGERATLVRQLIEVYASAYDLGSESIDTPSSNQILVEIYNPYTYQRSAFNPHRSNRKSSTGNLDQLRQEVEQTRGNDPFCNYEEKTYPGPFGRITGNYTVTAANEFAGAQAHGILIYQNHDPFYIPNVDEIQDRLTTTERWFKTAHSHQGNQELIFPTLIENRTPRAGATILHGHGQLSLKPNRHEGTMEKMKDIYLLYGERTEGRNYFTDIFEVYQSLELGFEVGNLKVFPSLTPTKDGEVIVFSEKMDDQASKLIQQIYRYFAEGRTASAFNMLIGYKPLENIYDWQNFPEAIIRFISRGNPWVKNSDFGGFELMGTSIISSDPYQINRELKSALNIN